MSVHWIYTLPGPKDGDTLPDGLAPAWSPDGQWLALSSASGEVAEHWLTTVGSRRLLALDLPATARIVDWIIWRP